MVNTERIILRNWREDDADALYKYASDEKVSELALWPRHTSVEFTRKVIRDFFIPNTETYAMVLKESNEPIGCIGLVPSGAEHHAVCAGEREIGYWIGRPYWGKGLTTEALDGLIRYYRMSSALKSLLLTADKRNPASHRVAEKCGFKRIGEYLYDGIESVAFRLPLSE